MKRERRNWRTCPGREAPELIQEKPILANKSRRLLSFFSYPRKRGAPHSRCVRSSGSLQSVAKALTQPGLARNRSRRCNGHAPRRCASIASRQDVAKHERGETTGRRLEGKQEAFLTSSTFVRTTQPGWFSLCPFVLVLFMISRGPCFSPLICSLISMSKAPVLVSRV